jgi:hypothetical protein
MGGIITTRKKDSIIELKDAPRNNKILWLFSFNLAICGIIAASYLLGGYYTCLGSGGVFLKGWRCAQIETITAIQAPQTGAYIALDIPKNCSIPDGNSVRAYCQKLSYQGGWLDSQNCAANQVRCYKEEGDAHYYHCVNYAI